MQPIIELLRERLAFDLKSLELLAELNEEFLVREDEAKQARLVTKRDKKRISQLEFALDAAEGLLGVCGEIEFRG